MQQQQLLLLFELTGFLAYFPSTFAFFVMISVHLFTL
jgi:hypothetical protein